MASSYRSQLEKAVARGVLVIVALVTGCSVGEGTGEITGRIIASDCGLVETEYELFPSFFSAEVTDDQLNLRVQRGSDLESHADGLMIHVGDVNEVDSARLGLPIPLAAADGDLVTVLLYLNETCPSGFPDEQMRRPLILEATGGSVVFDAVYAPDRDAARTAIEVELVDVVFTDREIPDERNATLGGTFSLFYQRGSPAQRFP